MRLIPITCWVILTFGALLGGQSDEPGQSDAYSISSVKTALSMRAGGRKVIFSVTQKQITKLGDGVSIALLKILDQGHLVDPQTISDFLPIIRDAFDQPQLIMTEVDRQPKVTSFLLTYLQQNFSDPAVLENIRETIEFVKSKAGH